MQISCVRSHTNCSRRRTSNCPNYQILSPSLTAFAANDLNASTSLLGSIVVRCRDLFLGYCAGYETATSKITKNDIGLAYYCPDVDFHFRCTNIPSEYGLSVLYKGISEFAIVWEKMARNYFCRVIVSLFPLASVINPLRILFISRPKVASSTRGKLLSLPWIMRVKLFQRRV